MANEVIRIENVSKQYRLGQVGTGTISHDINRWWYRIRGKEDPYLKIGDTNDRSSSGGSEYVWALRDVSFTVNHGDVVGIIGRNGAGKSTLLKILSRTTMPTTGSIRAKGRIASLLEVGTGFNPELSGRDNVYLNGAIMGMNRKEIDRKFDEIVDFAGIAKYIDTPVKRYSSGMYVSLGFAVAAHLEPEILVVDEVLAVGDAEFQKKALGKMKSVSQSEGRTVLFVSHNMAAVQNLCNKGVLMNQGTLADIGEVSAIINAYQQSASFQETATNLEAYSQSDKAVLTDLYYQDAAGNQVSSFKMGEGIGLVISFMAKETIRQPSINIRLNDNLGTAIVAWRTTETMEQLNDLPAGRHEVKLQVPAINIMDGIYNISISIHEGMKRLVYAEEILPLEILPDKAEGMAKAVSRNRNIIFTPCNWDIKSLETA